MVHRLKMRWFHIAEHIMANGFRSLIKETMFVNRSAIAVGKDLSEVTERNEPLRKSGLDFIKLDAHLLDSCRFALKHRYLKAQQYLRSGFGGHALARDDLVVGEMYYYTHDDCENPSELHRDLQWLGFKSWHQEHIYSFDIFVTPEFRGNGVSAALQNNAMFSLRSQGYTKAFAYYWADNVPAVWNTRNINKWRELWQVDVTRFILYRKALRRDMMDTRISPESNMKGKQ